MAAYTPTQQPGYQTASPSLHGQSAGHDGNNTASNHGFPPSMHDPQLDHPGNNLSQQPQQPYAPYQAQPQQPPPLNQHQHQHQTPVTFQQQQPGQQPQQHENATLPPQQQPAFNANPNNGAPGQGSANGAQQSPDGGREFRSETGTPKTNRLRKACDSCSIRKVKCDESGIPCRACAALEIPCTFNRPSRRRGPPNRHAEAIKKRKLNESPEGGAAGFPGPGNFSEAASPSNVAATLASLSSHAVLSAESICPLSTLQLLVDDFFTYIHPLVPFPHEPSFRAAFEDRQDLTNPSFLALLASMISALVASFPRKPRLHLKAEHREKLFPNSIALVDRCNRVAWEARGPGYLDRELTVYDAATSYLLGLSSAYTFRWRQCRLYFGETLSIVRVLGLHKLSDPGYQSLGSMGIAFGSTEDGYGAPSLEPVDYIRQEIGRRIFWVLFVGIRHMQQMGASFSELIIHPPTHNEPYPPLPIEVDDAYLYVSHVGEQPPGVISEITGFNLNVQIYMTVTPLATMELSFGIDEVFDWGRQKRVLEQCLKDVKKVLENAPRELTLAPGAPVESDGHQASGIGAERFYFPPISQDATPLGHRNGMPSNGMPPNGNANIETPEQRRAIQYEAQKANIYASQLGTRSYIVEKYWNLLDAYNRTKQEPNPSPSSAQAQQGSPGVIGAALDSMLPPRSAGSGGSGTSGGFTDMVESHMSNERESIIKDLLRVLGSISQVNMEPNGGSFINKIRQIASTLLDTPRNRKGPLALKAEEYLARFLDVLMKLERISPGRERATGGGGGAQDRGPQAPPSQGPPSLMQELRANEGLAAGVQYGQKAAEEYEDEELRNWADIREYQNRFLKAGGFLNEF